MNPRSALLAVDKELVPAAVTFETRRHKARRLDAPALKEYTYFLSKSWLPAEPGALFLVPVRTGEDLDFKVAAFLREVDLTDVDIDNEEIHYHLVAGRLDDAVVNWKLRDAKLEAQLTALKRQRIDHMRQSIKEQLRQLVHWSDKKSQEETEAEQAINRLF